MTKINKLLILALILLSINNFISSNCFAKNSSNLTILSEPNMTYALIEIARAYSKENNAIVSVNFDSPAELIQNIEIGEPSDIFISSHPNWTEYLKAKGLVDIYNLTNISKDELVLITSKENHKFDQEQFDKFVDNGAILKVINKSKALLIIDSDHNSLGIYTKQALEGIKMNANYIYNKIYEDKKSIINFVSDNSQYCAIVMKSGIYNKDNIKILAEIINIDAYYQALVVAGENMQEGRNFVQFLKSEEVKNILRKNGLDL